MRMPRRLLQGWVACGVQWGVEWGVGVGQRVFVAGKGQARSEVRVGERSKTLQHQQPQSTAGRKHAAGSRQAGRQVAVAACSRVVVDLVGRGVEGLHVLGCEVVGVRLGACTA